MAKQQAAAEGGCSHEKRDLSLERQEHQNQRGGTSPGSSDPNHRKYVFRINSSINKTSPKTKTIVIASVTNYHKCISFKQCKFILLQFWKPGV